MTKSLIWFFDHHLEDDDKWPKWEVCKQTPQQWKLTYLFNFKAPTFEMVTWAEPIYVQLTSMMLESLGLQSREKEQDLALKFHYNNRKVCKSLNNWWTFHKQHKVYF